MRRLLALWVLVGLLLVPGAVPARNDFGEPGLLEETQRYLGAALSPYIVSGCAPTVPASSLTFAAFACTGFVADASTPPKIIPVVQDAIAVGPLNAGNGTYWLAIHRNRSTTVAGWARQPGTHYLWQLSATQPTDPSGGLLFAHVTVTTGAISAVSRMRQTRPLTLANISTLVSLLEHHMLCDGVTDAGRVLQRVVTALGNTPHTLLFPEGTCLFTTGVTGIVQGTTVRGVGVATILKRGPAFTGNMFTLTTGATDITFADLTYDGNRIATDPSGNQFIQGSGNTRLTLKNIYAHDYTDKFVNLDGVNDYFSLQDSRFINSYHRGVMSFAGSYAHVQRNVFVLINDACVDIIDADYAIVEGNTCLATGTAEAVNDGIVLNAGNQAVVAGNTVRATGRAMYVYKGDSARTTGNSVNIVGNQVDVTVPGTHAAIHIDNGVTYTGVNIQDNQSKEGKIYVAGLTSSIISGNILQGSNGYIQVEAAGTVNITDVIITENHLGTPANAFDVIANAGRTIADITFRGNFVKGATTRGFFFRGGGTVTRPVLENNYIPSVPTRIDSGGVTVNTLQRQRNIFTLAMSYGRSVLIGGTVTVTTAEVEAADNIALSRVVLGGTPGHLSVGTIVAGTSFVINSSDAGDTSTVFWDIVH